MWVNIIKSFLNHCFFFNDTATTEIYTLSLHDALPISPSADRPARGARARRRASPGVRWRDRKSTRLKSSHITISYAVFCLTKKKKIKLANLTKQRKQYSTAKQLVKPKH